MKDLVIKGGQIINEGTSSYVDIHIRHGRIEKVDGNIMLDVAHQEIVAEGLLVIPGIIDDQVHFREPGLIHKASIKSESRAALLGGVTSFMEMPNTKPPALTQELLSDKYAIAARDAYANYSFYMGASNDNIEEVLKTNGEDVCGIKIFMGSSTGNMLVDDAVVLEKLFEEIPLLIATHCEDEGTIRKNNEEFIRTYGREKLTAQLHPLIRSREGCLLSSRLAKNLAEKYGTRLHILHISTADEIELFRNDIPLSEKKITAEVCVHHLYFNADDYSTLGNKIKCNPAIKNVSDQDALFAALLDDTFDVIATDHAPHTHEEKSRIYIDAPSGLPLVQHSLTIMLDFYHRGKISLPKIVEKMCHAPAICFGVRERGFIREGYHADLVIVDPKKKWSITSDNIAYKCGWSPLEGREFQGQVKEVILNGVHAVSNGQIMAENSGERLCFYGRN